MITTLITHQDQQAFERELAVWRNPSEPIGELTIDLNSCTSALTALVRCIHPEAHMDYASGGLLSWHIPTDPPVTLEIANIGRDAELWRVWDIQLIDADETTTLLVGTAATPAELYAALAAAARHVPGSAPTDHR